MRYYTPIPFVTIGDFFISPCFLLIRASPKFVLNRLPSWQRCRASRARYTARRGPEHSSHARRMPPFGGPHPARLESRSGCPSCLRSRPLAQAKLVRVIRKGITIWSHIVNALCHIMSGVHALFQHKE